MIDLHTHILHGFDDGAQSLLESVEMARIAAQNGVEKIVGTPHLFRGDFKNGGYRDIEKKKDELKQSLDKEGIEVEIYSGAEVHVSHNLIDEIQKNKEFLVINNSTYMLLEFPANHIFSGVKELFFQLMSEEIEPIIAHPERNTVFRRNPNLLYDLLEMGVLVQANSGSFEGLYGSRTQEAVFQFLEWKFIHFLGSDAHNTKSMAPKLADSFFIIKDTIGEKEAYALVWDNPQAVLHNEVIPYRPEPVLPAEEKKSAKIKIPTLFKKKNKRK